MNQQYLLAKPVIGLLTVAAGAILSGCTQPEHFLTDRAYREQTEQSFEHKKTCFADTALFAVFDSEMTLREREAMQFLYAYMSVGDIADYKGDFYLKNVRSSFEAQREMPWGKVIPETIFRHFVLPIRINNENLDESRMVFYDELKDRVKDLPLHDAVLEVNHWCHEKVIYTPSDSRTSSPLASVRTAFGRCGEESTFAVAALRSVGIPARQVYTPRWAHTDDNHAWVEAWVDGQWYFMGACEPEPVLNLGWFNAPASRGMLMHTKVFGYYDGPEEIMERTACYTEINVIDNYAPTAKVAVTIQNADGTPAKGATVEFKLYNYAEFYTVAKKTADDNGQCSLTAGKGDMLVWATKDGRFGYGKVSFGQNDNLTVILNKTPGETSEAIDFDIVPPVAGNIAVDVSDAQREANDKRLRNEDSIRNCYVATFYTEEKALEAPQRIRTAADWLVKSRGNYSQIEQFVNETPDSLTEMAINLLRVVSEKDLRDTPADVLFDHLRHTPSLTGNPTVSELSQKNAAAQPHISLNVLYERFLMNPRVSNELITAYKQFFHQNVDPSLAEQTLADPQTLVRWVADNIRVRDDLNPQRIPVMPIGVWKARTADAHSRNIFFVAMARSIGVPARIEPVAGKVQYFYNKWIDVDFNADAASPTITGEGRVSASYTPVKTLDNPKYYSHFTIAKILPDARLQTLNFRPKSRADMGGGNTWSDLLRESLALDEGNYLLVNGTRMADGKVLTRLTFFTVQKDKTTSIALVMREDADDIRVLGNIDAEANFTKADGGEETSILNAVGRGYFVIGILGARQEPTNHAMRDIAQLKTEFEKWNRSVILLFKNEQNLSLFDRNEFGALPTTVAYGIDANGAITGMIAEAMKLTDVDALPIFIIADTFGRVVFCSQGYTIGLGEQMMKVIRRL